MQSGFRHEAHAQAQDLQHVEQPVQAQRRFPLFDRVDEPGAGPREVGNLLLGQPERTTTSPDLTAERTRTLICTIAHSDGQTAPVSPATQAFCARSCTITTVYPLRTPSLDLFCTNVQIGSAQPGGVVAVVRTSRIGTSVPAVVVRVVWPSAVPPVEVDAVQVTSRPTVAVPTRS